MPLSKTVTVCLAGLLLAAPACSLASVGPWSAGFKAGFGFADSDASAHETAVDIETFLGGGGGLVVSGRATQRISLDFELLHMRKGIDLRSERYTLDYVLLGLNARYGLLPTRTTPYVLLGAELGYLAAAQKEVAEPANGAYARFRVQGVGASHHGRGAAESLPVVSLAPHRLRRSDRATAWRGPCARG